MAVGILASALLARMLGPDGRGLLAQILFWPEIIAVFFTLSLGDAVVYRLRNSTTDEAREHRLAVAQFAVMVAVVLSLVAIVAGFFALPVITDLGSQDIARARLYLVAIVLSQVLSIVINGYERSRRNFVYMTIERLLLPVTYAGLLAGLFFSGYRSIDAIIWCHVIGITLALAYRLKVAARWLFVRAAPLFDRKLLRNAAAIHGHTVLVVAAGQVDRMLVVMLLGAREIGYYVVALAIAMIVPGLIQSILQVIAMPAITGIAVGERDAGVARMLRLTFLTLCGGAVAVIAIIPFAVPLLFGRQFEPMIGLACAMVVAVSPRALRQMFVQVYLGIGRARFAMICDAVYLACFVVTFAGAAAAGLPWAVVWAVAAGNLAALAVCVAFLRPAGLAISFGDWLTLRPDAIREYVALVRTGLGETVGRRGAT